MRKYDASSSIGVFDSGLGGLTTVSELRQLMPNENIVYFGDTGRVPYGTKSFETIKKYTIQDMQFLLSKNIKALVCACNTASIVITNELAESLNVPFYEVLTPAVDAAIKQTKNNKIGVICTSATKKSGAYQRELLKLKPSLDITVDACPLFVPLVENGFTDFNNEVARLVVCGYLENIKASNIDTLILGCTHYPILKDIIADVMGDKVVLIDSGVEVAKSVYDGLAQRNLISSSKKSGECLCFVSDDPTDFKDNADKILKGSKIDNAVKIDIDNY